MLTRFRHSDPLISGVCSRLADQAAVPVAAVRVVALVLLVMHPVVMVPVYFIAAIWMPGSWQPHHVDAPPPPPAWDRDGLTDRFSRLERRLNRMETAAVDETSLRRAFRDLER